MGKILDFDRARKERGETPVLRAFGRDLPVTRSVPAGYVLYADQLTEEKPDGRFTLAEWMELLKHAVGPDNFAFLVEEGLEYDDVHHLLRLLRQVWTNTDEDDEGEAQAPEQGAGSDT